MSEDPRIARWLEALAERHRSSLTSSEFLKAVRALSARYVERRATLGERSPLDSAGKRAAFAAFYAPLHFFVVREVVRSLGISHAPLRSMLDLGCGTGVASAAWALTVPSPTALYGIDNHAWTVQETAWNWRHLQLEGRARRADLVDAAARVLMTRGALHQTAVVAGWSVNELPAVARRRLLPVLLACATRGARLLVLEPLAHAAAPWWDEWAAAFTTAGGRADVWKFDISLPTALADLDQSAGFKRDRLACRSLCLPA